VLLGQHADYTLMLKFWGHHAEQTFTASDRGHGRSWTLVLEGELEERTFAAFEGSLSPAPPSKRLLRVSTLKQESVSFFTGSEDLHLRCDSDTPCVSLHLFSPPLLSQGTHGF